MAPASTGSSVMHSELGTPFLLYASAVAVLLTAALLRFLTGRAAVLSLAALLAWGAYALLIGRSGVAAEHSSIPPGITILIAPAFALVFAVGLSTTGRYLATAVPLWLLIGFQTFRVGVEHTLTNLTEVSLAPHLLTLGAGNFEVLVAMSAPFAAVVAITRPGWRGALLAWNAVGLVSLANVAARAVLTAPGPLNLIKAEVPDVAIVTYPFTFIPGCMAPLAVLLHILAIRSLAAQQPARRKG